MKLPCPEKKSEKMINILKDISPWLSILSIIVAIFAASISYNQYQLVKKQMYLHIGPDVNIKLTTHIKNGYYQPVLLIRNLSPINISSLKANYLFLKFNKSTKVIDDAWTTLTQEQFDQSNLIFRKRLEPNDYCSAETGNVIGVKSETIKSNIFIYLTFLTFYRESDMKRFDIKKIYFFDDGKIFEHKDFINHPDYERIIETIKLAQLPEHDTLRYIPKKDGGQKEKSESREKLPPPPAGMRLVH